jgi:hypothetical protein
MNNEKNRHDEVAGDFNAPTLSSHVEFTPRRDRVKLPPIDYKNVPQGSSLKKEYSPSNFKEQKPQLDDVEMESIDPNEAETQGRDIEVENVEDAPKFDQE